MARISRPIGQATAQPSWLQESVCEPDRASLPRPLAAPRLRQGPEIPKIVFDRASSDSEGNPIRFHRSLEIPAFKKQSLDRIFDLPSAKALMYAIQIFSMPFGVLIFGKKKKDVGWLRKSLFLDVHGARVHIASERLFERLYRLSEDWERGADWS